MRCGLWLQSHTRYDGGMDQALAQITERVRAAVADQTPLRIRGGGTKDFHGRALRGDVLDTRLLSGITSYEPSELVITARASTPLAELEAALAAKGQCLPFEPPHFSPGATVGGMVAAGLSGPARASVGAVRDYVLGVSLINGKAEPLTFGGQVMKNVAGYDVSRLMAGSWGTLGLLTEVSLKVLPGAPAEATLRFECNQADALRKLHAWGGQPLPLNASCWLHDTVVDAGVGTLYVRLRGAAAAVEAACKTMGGTRLDNASTAPTHSPSSARGKRICPTISSAWATSPPGAGKPLSCHNACRVSSTGRLTGPRARASQKASSSSRLSAPSSTRALTVGFIAVLGRSAVAPQDIRRPTVRPAQVTSQ